METLLGSSPPPTYVVGKGGASLLPLRLESPEVRILINGPGMLYESLRLVTSLGLFDGCHFSSLQRLAAELEAEVRCGAVGRQEVEIEVVSHRAGARLEFGLGPPSMYQSELVIRTRSGEPLGWVVDSALTHRYVSDYIVALEPIPASGHMEHEPLALFEEKTHGHS